jgi:hypothetical protein
MRDVSMLPLEGRKIIAENNAVLRKLILKNIRSESKTANAGDLADMVLTFFPGLCIEGAAGGAAAVNYPSDNREAVRGVMEQYLLPSS